VVGESWTGRAYELREALQQCAVSHHFCLVGSPEGRELVARARDGAELPLVVFPDGRVLENPTNLELSQSTGGPINPDQAHFDVVIVGAGPAGLSAAVYGTSEGFSTLVVDKGGIGGQATLSSLIRNYLGFPRGVSGRQLAQNAYSQAWVFGADFAFMQAVTDLARQDDHLVVTLSDGGRVRASAVLLAMGVSYRRLGVPSLEALHGAGVYYGGSTSEAPALVGRDVVVVGGANSAGQSALHLAQFARRVTLVIRAGSLRDGMSDYLVRQVEATDKIVTRLGCEVVGGGGHGQLDHLVLRDIASKSETTVDAQALFVLIGAAPHTGWLPTDIEQDERGFILTGGDISQRTAHRFDRIPFLLETSMPGVFAAGDVRHGSVKRVATAVGEGSIAIQLLHQYFAAQHRKPHGLRKDQPSAVN
jgi:thioredoxin reductase (NADPH)